MLPLVVKTAMQLEQISQKRNSYMTIKKVKDKMLNELLNNINKKRFET